MADELDDIHAFETRDTAKKIPLGWQILFWGLIIWGIYYTAVYTPAISGWSQERAYTDSLKP
jgi:choline-glycine betaine transporter